MYVPDFSLQFLACYTYIHTDRQIYGLCLNLLTVKHHVANLFLTSLHSSVKDKAGVVGGWIVPCF